MTQDHTKHLLPLLVSTGRMPNMMCASRRRAPPNVSASCSSTRPRPSTRGSARCARGSTATPLRSASNSTKVPMVSALRKYDFLVLFPHQSADAGAVPRSLHPQPGQRRPHRCRTPARTAPHPSRQAASHSSRRAPPCAPSNNSSNIVAAWSATKCGSPTASRAP